MCLARNLNMVPVGSWVPVARNTPSTSIMLKKIYKKLFFLLLKINAKNAIDGIKKLNPMNSKLKKYLGAYGIY